MLNDDWNIHRVYSAAPRTPPFLVGRREILTQFKAVHAELRNAGRNAEPLAVAFRQIASAECHGLTQVAAPR
jgi:hypothetical protein